jgi:hypothetical protein
MSMVPTTQMNSKILCPLYSMHILASCLPLFTVVSVVVVIALLQLFLLLDNLASSACGVRARPALTQWMLWQRDEWSLFLPLLLPFLRVPMMFSAQKYQSKWLIVMYFFHNHTPPHDRHAADYLLTAKNCLVAL